MEQALDPSALVQSAKPYAARCGDIPGFAAECAAEVARSGEPAFYMTTIKDPAEPDRFPVGLEMRGHDDATGASVVVARMDVDRPEYRDNPHGFKGNHLVMALIETAREALQALVPEGVLVLTSQREWRSLTQGPGYAELKARRALERFVPEQAQGARKVRSRL